jgi:5,10-methylene-tetrahydrofolate dehydrogenase/methenyl tetrahydrofolate cyclohydrolase
MNRLEETAKITEEMILKGIVPGLGVLRVGKNPEHVALEEELVTKARTMGIAIEKYIMNEKSEESDVIDVIEVLNTDYKLHAVVMPGPLPAHMDEANVRGFLGDAGKAVNGEADELLYQAAVKAQKWAESYEE